jgi:Flp pilus assembly protein TadD
VFRFLLRQLGRVAVLATALAVPLAQADDYADVSQLLRGGKIQEAMAKAEKYLATKPRDPQMRFLQSVIQTEAGQNADAMATLIQLTQEYPELPEPHNNLAVLYAAQSRLDQARAALEMAIRTKPDYAIAHENLGDVHARLAGQSYARALQLDSANTSARPKLTQIRNLLTPGNTKPAAPAPINSPSLK